MEKYGNNISEEETRGIFQALNTVFEGGKRTINENDEEGCRENISCDKDYDDNYQS